MPRKPRRKHAVPGRDPCPRTRRDILGDVLAWAQGPDLPDSVMGRWLRHALLDLVRLRAWKYPEPSLAEHRELWERAARIATGAEPTAWPGVDAPPEEEALMQEALVRWAWTPEEEEPLGVRIVKVAIAQADYPELPRGPHLYVWWGRASKAVREAIPELDAGPGGLI